MLCLPFPSTSPGARTFRGLPRPLFSTPGEGGGGGAETGDDEREEEAGTLEEGKEVRDDARPLRSVIESAGVCLGAGAGADLRREEVEASPPRAALQGGAAPRQAAVAAFIFLEGVKKPNSFLSLGVFLKKPRIFLSFLWRRDGEREKREDERVKRSTKLARHKIFGSERRQQQEANRRRCWQQTPLPGASSPRLGPIVSPPLRSSDSPRLLVEAITQTKQRAALARAAGLIKLQTPDCRRLAERPLALGASALRSG